MVSGRAFEALCCLGLIRWICVAYCWSLAYSVAVVVGDGTKNVHFNHGQCTFQVWRLDKPIFGGHYSRGHILSLCDKNAWGSPTLHSDMNETTIWLVSELGRDQFLNKRQTINPRNMTLLRNKTLLLSSIIISDKSVLCDFNFLGLQIFHFNTDSSWFKSCLVG